MKPILERTRLKSACAYAALAALGPAHAGISVDSASFVYTQSFDSLTSVTVSATPWSNDATLPGWSLFNRLGATVANYQGSTGNGSAGTFYSYGATSSAERALGSVATGGSYFGSPAAGAVAGYIAVAFTNASSTALAGFTLNFGGEQWRDGGATVPNAQSLTVQYGYGSTFAGVTDWVSAGSSFDVVSPVLVNTGGGAVVNGNVAGRVNGLGGTVSTNWAVGETLWLRWTDLNDVGNDHGLAIDDLSFGVSAVPEPGMPSMLAAGLAVLGFVAARRRRA